MDIEQELIMLTEKAKNDKILRDKLLNTQNSEDSLKTFCEICEELGFKNITIYGMLTAGEEFCAAMLRSVNGGGVESPEAWDDYYERIMIELKHMN